MGYLVACHGSSLYFSVRCSKKGETGDNMADRKVPIVLVAFGSTKSSLDVYRKMAEETVERFPGHRVVPAFSSRMVREKMGNKKQGCRLAGPEDVLAELESSGLEWAVVQSLHITAGHEFDRLVSTAAEFTMRTSIGLPLLTTPDDYAGLSAILQDFVPQEPERGVVFVGHGTDHPAWSAYPALENILRKRCGARAWVGVVDGKPGPREVVREVRMVGLRAVNIVPIMLVAGVHLMENIKGEDEDSWASVFRKNRIETSISGFGLLELRGVREMFLRHVEDALDVIMGR